MAIRVWARVETAAAVRCGSAVSGTLSIDLSDENLMRLTPEQRDELARLPGFGSQALPGGHDSPATIPGGRLDVDALTGWLDISLERHRVALARKEDLLMQMRTACERYLRGEIDSAGFRRDRPGMETLLSFHETAGHRQVRIDDSDYDLVPGCREAHEKLKREEAEALARQREAQQREDAEHEARKRAEAEAIEVARATHVAAVTVVVREHGTQSQILRMQEGLLPEAEAEAVVHEHLFDCLADWPRYERMDSGDIEHAEGCYSDGAAVELEGGKVSEVPEAPYERLCELRKLAGETVTIVPLIHRARCGGCEAETVSYSARASIQWHGREYAHEYALD